MIKICKKMMIPMILILSLASSTVLGMWRISGRSVNVLTTATFANCIIEEYQRKGQVLPGQKIKKVVNVKNQGTRDSFVRVKVTGILGSKNSGGRVVQDPELDPKMIQVEYNTSGWKYMEDGYWYYTGILQSGAVTSEPLLKSFCLSEKADNRYKNKDGEILVEMESIQASANALEELWGIKETDLGIKTKTCKKCEKVTKVTLNKESQVEINEGDADLFANFKNLLPGCARTQKIRLCNLSGKQVKFFLKAEKSTQQLTEKETKLVNKLLSQYARIEVKEGKHVLYKGAVNGQSGKSGERLTDGIGLGTFDKGTKKNLTVTLSMSTEMDNAYQNLTGKVNWIFYAVGDETADKGNHPESATGEKNADDGNSSGENDAQWKTIASGRISPVTGDKTDFTEAVVLLILGLLLASGAGKIMAIRKRR